MKKNIKEMALLNEELSFKKTKINYSFRNRKIFSSKAKSFILKKINNLSKIKNNEIRKKTIIAIETIIKENISSSIDTKIINLRESISSYREYKGIKNAINYPELSSQMKIIYEKELKYNDLKIKKYEIKTNKKLNFITKKFLEKNEIKLSKLKIRQKDLKSFIKNGSILKKVYLSDEPKLTSIGWLKLMVSYGFILLWAAIILWPIISLVKSTLNDNVVAYLNTSDFKFGFSSFNRLFSDTNFITWTINTIIIAAITSAITVFLALLMGYAFSRFRFKGKKTSLISVMLLQMVPSLAALTVFYVLYTVLNQQFNISGHVVLILIYIGGGVAGNTFIMKGYMDSISTEIDEAAKIDGLSQWKIFIRIIVPLTKPMIALVGLWSFIGPFGDFILPGLLLSEDKQFTLARGLTQLTTDPTNQDQGAFAAGAILVSVPISLLFVSLRKFLVGGITAGGVKG